MSRVAIIKGDNGPACVTCGVVPEHYPTAASEREHKEISGLCPICWHLSTMPTDAAEDEIEEAFDEMSTFGVKPNITFGIEDIVGNASGRYLICLKCQDVVKRGERRAHVC